MNEGRNENRAAGGGPEPRSAQDLVARLIRLADEGPEVPPGGAEAVKERIRPIWRAGVRARVRRRLMWTIGGLAAAAGVVLAVASLMRAPAGPGARIGAVVVVVGSLGVETPGVGADRLTSGDVGKPLHAGCRIVTGTSDLSTIRLDHARVVRLDSSTSVRLDSETAVTLLDGAIYIDSRGSAGSAVEVRTDLGTVREVGTQFEVRREDSSLLLRVREGRVTLSTDGGPLEVGRGGTLRVASDGSVERGTTLAYGQEWQWVQRLAAPFDIEGKSVESFLAWVSRETGLSVSYGDAEAGRIARTVVLHGELAAVTPADAAEIVLPGSGLRAERSGGRLVVTRALDPSRE